MILSNIECEQTLSALKTVCYLGWPHPRNNIVKTELFAKVNNDVKSNFNKKMIDHLCTIQNFMADIFTS